MRIRGRGFTLIELMVACAVVAILASVAYPSYLSHVRKSARASAKAQMLDIASREQQFLLANRNFVTDTQLQASGYALPADVSAKYTYSIAVTSAPPTFTVTFTPIGSQVKDGPLVLSSDGTKSPADKW
jgi:type IV pilus assembly protein PilE